MVEYKDFNQIHKKYKLKNSVRSFVPEFKEVLDEDNASMFYGITENNILVLDKNAKKYFDLKFEQFKQTISTKDKSR